jgi:hypothetical protein
MLAYGKYIKANLVSQFNFFHQVADAFVRRNGLASSNVWCHFCKCVYPDFHPL